MAGKGTYLGGSTILKPWRSNTEEGWEAESVVVGSLPKNAGGKKAGQTAKNKNNNEARKINELERQIEKYAKECAKKKIKGEAWGSPPEILKQHFGKKISYLRNSIRSHKGFIEIIKGHKKSNG